MVAYLNLIAPVGGVNLFKVVVHNETSFGNLGFTDTCICDVTGETQADNYAGQGDPVANLGALYPWVILPWQLTPGMLVSFCKRLK